MSKYSEKFKDPRWQRRRLEILERDGWKCCHCGNDKLTLHVHHLWYEEGHNPWDYPDDCFLVLCEQCHEIEHKDRKKAEQKLIQILYKAGFAAQDIDVLGRIFSNKSQTTPICNIISSIEWVLYNPDCGDILNGVWQEALKRERGNE